MWFWTLDSKEAWDGAMERAAGRLFHSGMVLGKKINCRYRVLWWGTSKKHEFDGGSYSCSL